MENISSNFEENMSMEALLESAPDIETGKIINGEVVSLDTEYAYVNIGGKTEGRVALGEYKEHPVVGNKTDVMLYTKRFQEGMYVLSHKAAIEHAAWEKFLGKYSENDINIITGQIIKVLGRGAIIGFNENSAFLPKSQAGDIRLNDSASLEKEYEFKIISIDEKKKSILVSRKVLIDEKRDIAWNDIISNYKIGDIIKGTAVNFVEFGAFVDLGGYEALLHNSDISWSKNFKKKKLLKLDEEREYKILDIKISEKKISIGIKQLRPDPWSDIESRLKVGDQVNGLINTVTNFGVFVEIEEGLEGLVSSADMVWSKRAVNPKDHYRKGQEVKAVILSINKDGKKLALGIKQLLPNPWDEIEKKFPTGSVCKNKIKKITNFGLFVNLDNDIDGLIHVSDLSWNDKENNTQKYKVGDELEFKILDINKKEMKIACGIKQFTESPWEGIRKKYAPRTKVSGVVSSIVSFGVFVKIEDDIEGLVHISEVSKNRIENINEHLKVGDKVNAIVLNVDVNKKKLSLSIKHFEMMSEKEELAKIMGSDISKTATIGELIKLKDASK